MNLSVLITDFLENLELEQNASHLTIRNYHHYLKRFLEFVGEIEPKNIDLNLVRKYRLYLSRWTDPKSKKPLKRVTQNYFLIALRSFLRYLADRGILTIPAKEVVLRREDLRSLKVLDETQLKELLEAADSSEKDGLRDRAVMETLFSTGLRVSELVGLNRDSIDLVGRQLKIVGRSGKERVVFLSEGACKWLERYLAWRKDTFKPLFIRFQGKVDPQNFGEAMRLTPRSIERIVEKYVKKLGLSVKATPQIIRNSFKLNNTSLREL